MSSNLKYGSKFKRQYKGQAYGKIRKIIRDSHMEKVQGVSYKQEGNSLSDRPCRAIFGQIVCGCVSGCVQLFAPI